MPTVTDRPSEQPKPRRYRTAADLQPVCPKCGVLMIAGRSEPRYRLYYCPVDGCDQATKKARNTKPLQ